MNPSYIAGFFDGEGCISIGGSKTFSPVIIIANTNPEPLYNIQSYFGGRVRISSHKNKDKLHVKRVYEWRLHSKEKIKAFLDAIYPDLIIKRKEADVMYKFLALPRTDLNGLRKRLKLDLQKLKKEDL